MVSISFSAVKTGSKVDSRLGYHGHQLLLALPLALFVAWHLPSNEVLTSEFTVKKQELRRLPCWQ